MRTTTRRNVLPVLLTGQLMATMDSSVVTVALPSIRRTYGADGATIQLIASGYVLTLGVLIVTGARLGDILGHRRAFLGGLAGFTVASALCAAAPSASVLVAMRTVQAGTAALMIPQVFSLIQLEFDGRARERAIGLYSMVLGLGVVVGQFGGGLIAGADFLGLGWRAVFLINVPIGLAAFAAGRGAPAEAAPERSARLDLTGVLLLTTAMVGMITPLMFGREYGWRPWAWTALSAGVLVLAGFLRHQRRLAARGGAPLLDPRPLRRTGVGPGLVACSVLAGCYAGLLFSLSLHLQETTGLDPLRAGLAFVPYAIGFAVMSLAWTRLPPWRHLPAAGTLTFAAVVALLAACGGWPGTWSAPLLMIAGAGHAAGYSPLISRLSRLVGPEGTSALAALNATGPMLASVTAVAVLGGIHLTWGLPRVETVIAALLVAGACCGSAAGARDRPR